MRPMSQPNDNSSRRCAVCRGKGKRSDGHICRGCDGIGQIPAQKIRPQSVYPMKTRVMVQWKRTSGLVQ